MCRKTRSKKGDAGEWGIRISLPILYDGEELPAILRSSTCGKTKPGMSRSERLLSKLPKVVAGPIRTGYRLFCAVLAFGLTRRCPVCGWFSREFRRSGTIPRRDALCPYCWALERHRFVWIYFKRKTDLFDKRPKKMLHIGPESCFASRLKKCPGLGYVSGDISDPLAMLRLDAIRLPFPGDTFDVVYCSHVLEHVSDDRAAIREFRRVMKKTGWAVFLVPDSAERTLEDPSVVEPADRLRVFGKEDHVRIYGPDFAYRLRKEGFRVEVVRVPDLASEKEARRMGLTPGSGNIYACVRDDGGPPPA